MLMQRVLTSIVMLSIILGAVFALPAKLFYLFIGLIISVGIWDPFPISIIEFWRVHVCTAHNTGGVLWGYLPDLELSPTQLSDFTNSGSIGPIRPNSSKLNLYFPN